MAQQPYPNSGVPDVYDVPSVDPSSYDATGLATQAGPVSDIPVPGMGHPAAYSGITLSANEPSEEN